MQTTAAASTREAEEAPWERRAELVYRFLPYFVACVSVPLAASATAAGIRTWEQFRLSLVLLALALCLQVAWHLAKIEPRERPVVAATFYTIRLLVTALLIALNPWYGVFAWINILDAVRFFKRPWSIVAVIATSFVVAGSYTGGYPSLSVRSIAVYLGVAAFNAVLAGLMGMFGHLMEEQSTQRKRAIIELAEVNQRLEDALRENAGLHEQLLAQAREAGVLDERARLATEIHDTIAQDLTGVVTQLQAAEAAGRDGEAQRHVRSATTLARRGLTEARRSVQALRPEALETASLPEALRQLAEDFRRTHGGDVATTVTGPPRTLPPEVEATLLRVAQEALANVGKHARAERVGVTLSYMDDVVTLDVRDDGAGFDAAGDRASGRGSDRGGDGFGLAGMRQRVGRLAGELAIESEPGAGTAISARVPAT